MSSDWQYKTAMEALNTAYKQLAIIVIVALAIIVTLVGIIAYLVF